MGCWEGRGRCIGLSEAEFVGRVLLPVHESFDDVNSDCARPSFHGRNLVDSASSHTLVSKIKVR